MIIDKEQCTGCSACFNICPVDAINMEKDTEGFLYPHINEKKCTHCRKCERVCPEKKSKEKSSVLECYTYINDNEKVLISSSSGGVFTAIAEYTICSGGVVFGAVLTDEFDVIHSKAESINDLYKFRGSKYAQSNIKSTYKEVKCFLDGGHGVCFSGTPCQLQGLRQYLGKDYHQLLLVGVICHGVPSSDIFRYHIKDIENTNESHVQSVNMRDKITGWIDYSVSYVLENGKKVLNSHQSDPFFKGFLNDLFLRPSCYNCSDKGMTFSGDILIGDYWGIENSEKYKEGVSAILCYTKKGVEAIEAINGVFKEKTEYELIYAKNPAIEKSPSYSYKRELFFGLKALGLRYVDVVEYLTAKEKTKNARLKSNYSVEDRLIKLLYEKKNLGGFFEQQGLRRIAIYGVEGLGRLFYRALEDTNLVVDCYIDQNYKLYNKEDVPVVRLDEIMNREIDCIVITALISECEIMTSLVRTGYDINHIFTLNNVVYGVGLEEEIL